MSQAPHSVNIRNEQHFVENFGEISHKPVVQSYLRQISCGSRYKVTLTSQKFSNCQYLIYTSLYRARFNLQKYATAQFNFVSLK